MCSIASLLYGDSVSAMEMEVEYPEQSFREEIIYQNNNNAPQNTGQKSQKSDQMSWRKNKVFTRSHSNNKYTKFQGFEYDEEYLNLKSSHSKLLQYKAFPNLKKLTILDHDLRCINKESPKFPKLEEIKVVGAINKENFASLLTLLSKAPNLKILNLGYVTMTVDNLVDFMNYTEDVRDYKFKELKFIGFIGKDEKKINALTELFIYVKEIESLDLSGIGLSILPASVETMKDLRILNICGNKLMTNLPEEIGELRNLRVLNLSGTRLTKLPEEIGNLSSLEELYLSSNMGDLPNSVTNLRNLRIFDASGCNNAKFWTAKLQTLKSANKNLEVILE